MRAVLLLTAFALLTPAATTAAVHEPRGLKLHADSGDNQVLLEWGATTEQTKQRLTYDAPMGSLPPMKMSGPECDAEDENCLAMHWTADFGSQGPAVGPIPPVLKFHDGKLYGYTIYFEPGSFGDVVRSALVGALGKPTTGRKATGQNAFGAKFPQETMYWLLRNTSVAYASRTSTIDSGTVIVIYKPLAPPDAEKEKPQAPF